MSTKRLPNQASRWWYQPYGAAEPIIVAVVRCKHHPSGFFSSLTEDLVNAGPYSRDYDHDEHGIWLGPVSREPLPWPHDDVGKGIAFPRAESVRLTDARTGKVCHYYFEACDGVEFALSDLRDGPRRVVRATLKALGTHVITVDPGEIAALLDAVAREPRWAIPGHRSPI